MKTYPSLNENEQHIYNGRIITFGLTEDQNTLLKSYTYNVDYEIYDADIASDLIAVPATAIIVNATSLDADDIELLENYHTEVGNEADEIVFWLGSPKPAIELQLLFKCLDDFDEMVPDFKKKLSKK